MQTRTKALLIVSAIVVAASAIQGPQEEAAPTTTASTTTTTTAAQPVTSTTLERNGYWGTEGAYLDAVDTVLKVIEPYETVQRLTLEDYADFRLSRADTLSILRDVQTQLTEAIQSLAGKEPPSAYAEAHLSFVFALGDWQNALIDTHDVVERGQDLDPSAVLEAAASVLATGEAVLD